MMDSFKNLWKSSGKWFLIAIPLASIIIGFSVWHAYLKQKVPEKQFAEPLAESEVTFDLEKNRAYTSDDGVIIIGSSDDSKAEASEHVLEPDPSPESEFIRIFDLNQVWAEEESLSTEAYTLPEEAILEDGSIGTLVISKIGLKAPVYETSEDGGEMESMTKGIAHFAVTSAWNGNIGLCSHNVAPKGAAAFFRDIHKLQKGDALTYITALGERNYEVTEIKEIASNDWSYLSPYEDGINRITMITCITGKPGYRLMVQASECVS